MNARRQARLDCLLQVDQPLWQQGLRIAGIDEVGRGPLAGCVLCACVIMPPDPLLEWVDDSKKLSEKRREQVFEQIRELALFIGIGRAEPEEIDRINILNATRLAMMRAAEGAQADLYLVDAMEGLKLDAPQRSLLHGDASSYSIAAASIVAKVTRDREMRLMDALHPGYGFASHKGYGTAAHIKALRELGPSPLHRASFLKNMKDIA